MLKEREIQNFLYMTDYISNNNRRSKIKYKSKLLASLNILLTKIKKIHLLLVYITNLNHLFVVKRLKIFFIKMLREGLNNRKKILKRDYLIASLSLDLHLKKQIRFLYKSLLKSSNMYCSRLLKANVTFKIKMEIRVTKMEA